MGDQLIMLLLDAAMVTSMLILAYLSKKMGDALKIRSYYLILYLSALLVAAASGMDVAAEAFSISLPSALSLGVRCCAGLFALGACLRYWSWLFSEFF